MTTRIGEGLLDTANRLTRILTWILTRIYISDILTRILTWILTRIYISDIHSDIHSDMDSDVCDLGTGTGLGPGGYDDSDSTRI